MVRAWGGKSIIYGLGALELAGKLRHFYACARGTYGREYSSSTLTSICSRLNNGLDKTKHKNAVTAADMRKLYGSENLSVDDPVDLQQSVYVAVSLHFCWCGRECLRVLKMDSFLVKCHENGREYVTIAYNELKNHQGISKHDIQQEPSMYSQIGESCPVANFKLYVST